MGPREFRHGLDDMLAAIQGIEQATAGKSFDEYSGDWMLKHAVERGIEIISEASRLLPAEITNSQPEIPWARVRGIGNILRHDYHRLSNKVIWGVVVDELAPLKRALETIKAAVDKE